MTGTGTCVLAPGSQPPQDEDLVEILRVHALELLDTRDVVANALQAGWAAAYSGPRAQRITLTFTGDFDEVADAAREGLRDGDVVTFTTPQTPSTGIFVAAHEALQLHPGPWLPAAVWHERSGQQSVADEDDVNDIVAARLAEIADELRARGSAQADRAEDELERARQGQLVSVYWYQDVPDGIPDTLRVVPLQNAHREGLVAGWAAPDQDPVTALYGPLRDQFVDGFADGQQFRAEYDRLNSAS